MKSSVIIKWLGVAGVELKINDQVLLIDPYFTRFPFRKMWAGKVEPDHEVIVEKVKHCNHVLITHAHWDHIMDVPDVVRNTGAPAYGSANSCQLLEILGVSERKIREIHYGDLLRLKDFRVEVLKARHWESPPFLPGPLASNLKPPLRAKDYRMDNFLSFLIRAGDIYILTDTGAYPEDAVPADVLFVLAGMSREFYSSLLYIVQPKLIIAYHWDDLFRPLSKPIKPFLRHPRLKIPPIERIDLEKFGRLIGEIAPKTKVIIPEIFKPYDLGMFIK